MIDIVIFMEISLREINDRLGPTYFYVVYTSIYRHYNTFLVYFSYNSRIICIK